MVIIQIVFIIFLSISYTYGDYSCKDGIQMCYVSDSVGEEKATCCYPGANACITEISSGLKGCGYLNEGENEGCNYYLDSVTGEKMYYAQLAIDGSADFCICKDHLCNYGNGTTSSYKNNNRKSSHACKKGSQICYTSAAGGRAACCKHGANACITKKSTGEKTCAYIGEVGEEGCMYNMVGKDIATANYEYLTSKNMDRNGDSCMCRENFCNNDWLI